MGTPRRAEVCRRLAAVSTVPHISTCLPRKAQEYETKATAPRLTRIAEVISEEMHLREEADVAEERRDRAIGNVHV
jgi:hypothetical protein